MSNWGVSGLPSDVSMYIYVPDNVRPNAPVLALIHYCGGTASAVFGQAQGGGLVRAADQYGFIAGGYAAGTSGQGASGDSGTNEPESADASGCGCTLVGAKSKAPLHAVIASLALGVLAGRWSRRRRTRS